METVIIKTRYGGIGRSPLEPFKNKDFKPVLIYSASQVWPRRDSPVTTTLTFTGSWQDSMQLPPHVRLRVRWPLRSDASDTLASNTRAKTVYVELIPSTPVTKGRLAAMIRVMSRPHSVHGDT